MSASADIFEKHRPVLFRLAYGMLGRVAPAEDAVQEAFLRWQKQDAEQIRSPKAWLSKVINRICLDEIKSARYRKEEYIGPDLPEPMTAQRSDSPEEIAEMAESLSMALLVLLEKLTPVQRAVFLLREVFDYDYASVAEIINKPEAHCRKIAQRARDQVQDGRPRFERNRAEQNKLVKAFFKAVQFGDISEIESMLARDAILYSDGGGKVTAARKPVAGASNIARFLKGIRKGITRTLRMEFTHINGEPGMIAYLDGKVSNVWAIHIENDKVQSIYVVLNPDKLGYVKREG